jgi:hypothetical protein
MKINSEDDLIKHIYDYDVIVLWMDINNSMNKGFLKYIDVNFPEIKQKEIKSGYGDLRKLGKINEIKTKNMTFCICYVYKNNQISINLLEQCSFLIKSAYNNKRIATDSIINEDLLKNFFENVDITIYNKEIVNFNLYFYRKFLDLKTKYKNGELTKEEYTKNKELLEKERTKGIY